ICINALSESFSLILNDGHADLPKMNIPCHPRKETLSLVSSYFPSRKKFPVLLLRFAIGLLLIQQRVPRNLCEISSRASTVKDRADDRLHSLLSSAEGLYGMPLRLDRCQWPRGPKSHNSFAFCCALALRAEILIG